MQLVLDMGQGSREDAEGEKRPSNANDRGEVWDHCPEFIIL